MTWMNTPTITRGGTGPGYDDKRNRAKSAPPSSGKMSIGRLAKEAHSPRTNIRKSRITARLTFPGEERPKSVTELYVDLLSPRKRDISKGFPEPDEAFQDDVKLKLTEDELDDMVERLNRPTFMSTARALSAKRNNGENPTRRRSSVSQDYIVHPERFSGSSHLPKTEVEQIVNRLSKLPRRFSRGTTKSEKFRKKSNLGILHSYAWQGIKNF